MISFLEDSPKPITPTSLDLIPTLAFVLQLFINSSPTLVKKWTIFFENKALLYSQYFEKLSVDL
jgi:hypothetical protein